MRKPAITEEEIQAIARGCARALSEKKGEDILILDLRSVNSYLDYFLITTANSLLHCRGMAKEAQRYMHEMKYPERSKARLDSGWIILDYSEIVVHIFTQDLRDYYQLERLWADSSQIAL